MAIKSNTPKRKTTNSEKSDINKKSNNLYRNDKIKLKKSSIVMKSPKSRRKPLKAESYKMQSFKRTWKEGANTLIERGRQRGFVNI